MKSTIYDLDKNLQRRPCRVWLIHPGDSAGLFPSLALTVASQFLKDPKPLLPPWVGTSRSFLLDHFSSTALPLHLSPPCPSWMSGLQCCFLRETLHGYTLHFSLNVSFVAGGMTLHKYSWTICIMFLFSARFQALWGQRYASFCFSFKSLPQKYLIHTEYSLTHYLPRKCILKVKIASPVVFGNYQGNFNVLV